MIDMGRMGTSKLVKSWLFANIERAICRVGNGLLTEGAVCLVDGRSELELARTEISKVYVPIARLRMPRGVIHRLRVVCNAIDAKLLHVSCCCCCMFSQPRYMAIGIDWPASPPFVVHHWR